MQKVIDKALKLCYNYKKYKEACIMEMEIAAMSMAMANSNLQQSLSVSMLKKTMEAMEDSMQSFTEMIDSMPSPDGRGQLLNVRV